MKAAAIITFFSLFISITRSQVLNVEEDLISGQPFFHTSFIKKNRVKSIIGGIAVKKELQIIKKTPLSEGYYFDEKGRLIHGFQTFHKGGGTDTSITTYQYDQSGRLKLKRKNDLNGFYAHRFEYDSLGNTVAEEYVRETEGGKSKLNYEPGKSFVIKNESYSYQWLGDHQLKKIYYNNQDKPYKEQIIISDTSGNVIARNARYIITGKREESTFDYDDYARLIKVSLFSNIGESLRIEHQYSYDKVGNVVEEKVYRNGKHTTDIQYLYHDDTMLLKARLVKEIASGTINIIQYEYVFWE